MYRLKELSRRQLCPDARQSTSGRLGKGLRTVAALCVPCATDSLVLIKLNDSK